MGQTGVVVMLDDLVATSTAITATRSRNAKAEVIAELLGRATGDDETVRIVVSYLSGELRQRRTGVGWRSLADLPEPASEPSLTVRDVDAAFAAIAELAGPGSQAARREAVADLFAHATAAEQQFLGALVAGELRQGALDGVMTDALARATTIPLSRIRAAVMLAGGSAPVAVAALTGGERALDDFRLEVGRAVQPMLASSAPDLAAALAKIARTGAEQVAIDYKLDGIRIQVHRDRDQVHVFTRSLDDITARCDAVVELVRGLPGDSAVLDGELIALRPDGRPHPFQVTGSHAATQVVLDRVGTGDRDDDDAEVGTDLAAEVILRPFFFDLLARDGRPLLGLDGATRHAELAELVSPELLIARITCGVDDVELAERFFAEAVAAGHEGVMVKALQAPYEAGRRGAAWVKVKPVHTLDLVVLAAEWGYGRRTGWLSNIHLGARDEAAGNFVMLGKTFKGMTDELLGWQTEQFPRYATESNPQLVRLRPHFVVEIAFDGVQTSTRYPGGMALRFARVLRYRPDKTPDQADTLQTVREIQAG